MRTIGFIGLGHMGNPMVKNLLRHNLRVKVYDVSESAMNDLVSEGALATQSLGDAVQEADIVFTMLQTGDQVKKCCLENDGIFSHLKHDALYIDSSSIDIETSQVLHNEAALKNIAMLDAPVSGGVAAASAGTLTFMVGGEEKNFIIAEPILKMLGKKVIHTGRSTHGAAAKICNNMLLGVSMIAVCEAFILADQLGLDPHKLFEVCNNASGQCWSLTHYCPWPGILPDAPANHDYKPGFTAKMMLKDLLLSQDAATHTKTNTPLGKHAMELYQQFVNDNYADLDFSGIIKMLKN